MSLGAAAITLQGPGSLEPILQGQYTVLLQPSFPDQLVFPAIAQIGMVPSTAQSLRFYGDSSIRVTFDGQPIPLSLVGSGGNFNIYGGDISSRLLKNSNSQLFAVASH